MTETMSLRQTSGTSPPSRPPPTGTSIALSLPFLLNPVLLRLPSVSPEEDENWKFVPRPCQFMIDIPRFFKLDFAPSQVLEAQLALVSPAEREHLMFAIARSGFVTETAFKEHLTKDWKGDGVAGKYHPCERVMAEIIRAHWCWHLWACRIVPLDPHPVCGFCGILFFESAKLNQSDSHKNHLEQTPLVFIADLSPSLRKLYASQVLSEWFLPFPLACIARI